MELSTPELLNTSRLCDSVLESDHHVLRKSQLDRQADHRADAESDLALNDNTSHRGMHLITSEVN